MTLKGKTLKSKRNVPNLKGAFLKTRHSLRKEKLLFMKIQMRRY
jgi:hypothetical protein